MEWFQKITKKVVKTAQVAVSDSVKAEAKNVASNVIPTLIGVGFVLAGFSMFRSSLVHVPKMVSAIAPTLSTTSVVTNNYFFDPSVQAQVLAKLLHR